MSSVGKDIDCNHLRSTAKAGIARIAEVKSLTLWIRANGIHSAERRLCDGNEVLLLREEDRIRRRNGIKIGTAVTAKVGGNQGSERVSQAAHSVTVLAAKRMTR